MPFDIPVEYGRLHLRVSLKNQAVASLLSIILLLDHGLFLSFLYFSYIDFHYHIKILQHSAEIKMNITFFAALIPVVHLSSNQSLRGPTPSHFIPYLSPSIHASVHSLTLQSTREKENFVASTNSPDPSIQLSNHSLYLIPEDKLKAENVFPSIMEDLGDHLKLMRGFKSQERNRADDNRRVI